jgi:hypothetical protein
MLEFAVAQDVCQNRVLKDESTSNRNKRLSCWTFFHQRKKDYARVSEDLEEERGAGEERGEPDAT